MKKRSIAVIGAGAIGSALVKYVSENMTDKISAVNVFDMRSHKSEELADRYPHATAFSSAEEASEGAALIIETAQGSAVGELMELAIERKKDLMVLSVGGLLGRMSFAERMEQLGLKLILPSGAVAGIDAVKAARIAGIEELEITTRKSPASLEGAPYLAENDIDLALVDAEQVVFDGSAREAIEAFPKNINIAVMLSIAGIGPERTKVRIIVSPKFTTNSHQVRFKGPAGEVVTTTWNVPSPENPKTSYMASLSAMASLEGYFSYRKVGT